MTKKVLVTGGAGYIGSHMVRLLLKNGYVPIVLDSLETGHKEFIPKSVTFHKVDLRNFKAVEKVFLKENNIDFVIHFAASLVVPESVQFPEKYYENNICSTLNLLKAMNSAGVGKIIFSSTAAVYGDLRRVPVKEDAPAVPASPYGSSKLFSENLVKDFSYAHKFKYVILRYFNVAGADPKGGIGIRHNEITHLIPVVMMAANGRLRGVTVFGDDYPTRDGTCIRDYIYVGDLADAHLSAMKYLKCVKAGEGEIFNLGTGKGYTVKEIIDTAVKVTGKNIRVKIGKRRAGDPAKIVASYAKAERLMNWSPKASLEEIIRTSWLWELLESPVKI